MIAFASLSLIAGYGAAASWAYRRGNVALIACGAAGLLLLALVAVGLGLWHEVPSVRRLTLYLLFACGPAILTPTWLLALLRLNPNPSLPPFPVALAGAAAGLALGYLMVVYGIVLWDRP
jgi:hypothetical protein